MSIRLTTLYIFVAIILVYAWKDWFKSLCGLILLMAVIEHEDMPKSILGIQGFNMWNVLFLGIFLAWVVSRRREGLRWDMPRHITLLLLIYLGVILIGVLRAVIDRSYLEDYPLKSLISEELINTIKWVLPGVLLFDGCRTRRRLVMVLVCLLVMYFLIATQVVRRMSASAVFSTGSEIDLARRHISDIGYGANRIAAMLAGASWAILAVLPLVRQKKYRVIVLAAAGMVAYGQALTGGRAGYLAWGATGLVLCLIKWRKYLILAPLTVILLPIVFPGAAERMLQGFGQVSVTGEQTIDDYSVTSGRNVVWPHVVDKIGESPLIGYGRLAMTRTGLREYLERQYGEGEAVGEPHNMYLETLLDNGILGSIPIFLFWGMLVIYSARLFRCDNRLCSAVGGLTLSLVLAQLLAGIGSQHFYPSESTLGMWAAIFLSLRVYLDRDRIRNGMIDVEGAWNSRALHQQVAITAVRA